MTIHRPEQGLADRFLASFHGQCGEVVVRRFHLWLDDKQLGLNRLNTESIQRFIEKPLYETVTPRTVTTAKDALWAYLDWLHDEGHLGFCPRKLSYRHKPPLSAQGHRYLDSLRPTHRPTTVKHYRYTLCKFEAWLADSRLTLDSLRRSHIEQWLLMLNDLGLQPSTRQGHITHVNRYLWWVYGNGQLTVHPEQLFLPPDRPRLPKYLPRPLPIPVDRQLQQRLAQSTDPLQLGLLVMRQTGIRIGELTALPCDCVQHDVDGTPFLKVPLGKLNCERLVPLTDATYRIVQQLQAHFERPRKHLIRTKRCIKVSQERLRDVLRVASEGLDAGAPITSHRLRHTYATTLLSAGMPLVGVMKLLGHRDCTMTLRYATVTQEAMVDAYHTAIHRLEERYAAENVNEFDPQASATNAIADAIAWINTHLRQPEHRSTARRLTARLSRICEQLEKLTPLL